MSLPEQKDAIERYAARFNIRITDWFEERQTAAKSGRPVWANMLRLLRSGTRAGVVMHKIDRSARNLRDWADLGEIIDRGIEVHFANEALDLNSRGGRLSADIQAVVAADYIRNLRDEAKKGIYGRLKQGYYPSGAPVGYLNHGGGKHKTIDPVKGPLVRRAFEMYATGRYNFSSLEEELFKIGLRNRNGGRLTRNGISTLLNNPFYIGIIRVRRNGQVYQGNHDPLITKKLFDYVQNVLRGKVNTRTETHNFLFRRIVKCKACGYSLIGELQKGRVYYRCQRKDCPTTSIREDQLEAVVVARLRKLQFTAHENECLADSLKEHNLRWFESREAELAGLHAKSEQIAARINRLTDAYLDGVIDGEVFNERKNALFEERRAMTDRVAALNDDPSGIPAKLEKFLELANTAYLLYQEANTEKKRQMVRLLTSNFSVERKTIEFAYQIPFNEIANREECRIGRPSKETHRILLDLLNSVATNMADVISMQQLLASLV